MVLERISFFRLMLGLVLAATFLRVYQYNLIVKVHYEKQRLEKTRKKLEQERNDLIVAYAQLTRCNKLISEAVEGGMKPLTVKQVVTLKTLPKIDFVGTDASEQVLVTLGLIVPEVPVEVDANGDA
jgi:hypothetical protein